MRGKNRIVAGVLALLLGQLGIHNFYLGNFKRGLVQLLCTSIGSLLTGGIAAILVWVWALFECVMIFTGRINTDAKGRPFIN